jgi:hypothetical protein
MKNLITIINSKELENVWLKLRGRGASNFLLIFLF